MSLLKAFERVAAQKPEPFIAPVPEADEVVVTTVQHNTTYRTPVKGIAPGWYRFYPLQPKPTLPWRFSVVGRNANVEAWVRQTYLEALPRFYVVAALPVSESGWLVVPLYPADAAQRGWSDGAPRTLHLVRDVLMPGEVVVARSLAGTLLYDSLDERLGMGAGGDAPGITSALDIYARYLEEQERQAKTEYIRSQERSVEDKLRFQLEFMGAKAEVIQPVGENYRVLWENAGRKFTTLVRKDARIQSAGFCISGQDHNFNLSAIVKVIEEGERQHRFDINGVYAESSRIDEEGHDAYDDNDDD